VDYVRAFVRSVEGERGAGKEWTELVVEINFLERLGNRRLVAKISKHDRRLKKIASGRATVRRAY
jgi:hypothetical protein